MSWRNVLIGCAALVAMVGLEQYRALDEAEAAARRVQQAHQVLERLGRIQGEIAMARSAWRGYTTGRDPELRQALLQARALLLPPVSDLERLAAGDPSLPREIAKLRNAVEVRIGEFEAAAAGRMGPAEPEGLVIGIVERVRRDQERVLDESRRRAERRSRRARAWTLGAGGLALVVALAAAVMLQGETSRRRAVDARFREVSAELQQMFEVSDDLFCVCGFDGVFRRINPAWQRTLGYSLDDLTRAPFIAFVHPDDWPATLGVFKGLLERRERVVAFENRYRAHDGTWRWLQWNSTPDFERQVVFAAARDVTAQREIQDEVRRARDAAEAANRELESFSYSVSHDLRAPLRAIDGFSQALVEDAGAQLDAEARGYLDRIRANAQRMGQLIDDLLSLSRLGRAEFGRAEVDVTRLARDVAEDVRSRHPDRAVEVHVEDGLQAKADPRLLRVALENLVGNAFKFTRDRSPARVEVGALCRNGDRGFFVRDNGAGFDMRYAHKLFGAFQRLHSATEFEGTGIGLATVARVVHRHGGRIWAEAEPDRGATFYFTLDDSPEAA